jgi:photosystem II stability/assembly factor-like uncharacterized protein
MRRFSLFCILVVSLGVSVAMADEQLLVLAVQKPIAAEILHAAGLEFLADLHGYYLVEGDELAAGRLKRSGANFSVVTIAEPGDEIFLVRPASIRDEVLYSAALHEVGPGVYVTKIARSEIDDLNLLPFEKARLIPTAFPILAKASLGAHAQLRPGVQAITPKPFVQALVAAVSADTATKWISQLSGHEPVVIGGVLDTLLTRYTYNWRFDHAAQYIYERFQDYGLDVDYHTYVVSLFDFNGAHFRNARDGWLVGGRARIYRTRDRGATWNQQSIDASGAALNGVSFVDTLTGWVVGNRGQIFKSTNGGATWLPQTSGTAVGLRQVFALDPQNAWAVGSFGTIRRTADGGANWTDVAGGGFNELYGCHFRSVSRGWIVGTMGSILFWDGLAVTEQTSGTTETLLDVDFIDDSVGWAVGSGWTVLKTIDGGLHWVSQSVPIDADPYLKGVCFVDSLVGWVVGSSGTILRTSDGGATWEVQRAGTLFGLRRVAFANGDEGWAVGSRGTILHTANGGANWTSQLDNLPAADIRVLKNIVATKPGTVSNEQVIICGHADDMSPDYNNLAPGAQDNASGTAAVIEAARVLAGSRFEKTIKFIAWSGEEQGLYGSGEYAAQAVTRGDTIAAVLNFDMIGYVDHAPEDIDLIGNDASAWLLDFTIDCANAYVPGLPTLRVINTDFAGSDHYTFWNVGYDAIWAMDNTDVYYPYLHTVNDTLGNLTMSFCSDVIRMGIATLAELAVPDIDAGVPSIAQPVFAVASWPNPFRVSTRVSFALGSQSLVIAGICGVEGRRVKSLYEGPLPAGRHALHWAGDDDAGAKVSPGVYFVRVQTIAGEGSVKLIVLR